MRRHYKATEAKPDQPRHICFRCRKKRYEDRMVKIFAHPLITGKNPFWACKELGWRQKGCSDEVIKEFTMYNETGALHLVPTR